MSCANAWTVAAAVAGPFASWAAALCAVALVLALARRGGR